MLIMPERWTNYWPAETNSGLREVMLIRPNRSLSLPQEWPKGDTRTYKVRHSHLKWIVCYPFLSVAINLFKHFRRAIAGQGASCHSIPVWTTQSDSAQRDQIGSRTIGRPKPRIAGQIQRIIIDSVIVTSRMTHFLKNALL